MLGKISMQRIPTLIAETTGGQTHFFVGNTVKIILANNKDITGQIVSITEKTVSLMCGVYEYTETGVVSTTNLILLKDIIDIESSVGNTEDISWKLYNSKLQNWG